MDSKFEIVLDEIKEKLLANVSEFSDYEAAQAAFFKDKQSIDLYNDIADRKQTLSILEAQGLPIEPKQEETLAKLMEEMRANKTIMEFLKSRNNATSKAKKIANYLSDSFGVPFSVGGGCCG